MVSRMRNRMLTTSEVAAMLFIHINTVRRWSDQGILKPYRIGPRGDRRFMREDIIQLRNTPSFGYTSVRIENKNNDKTNPRG